MMQSFVLTLSILLLECTQVGSFIIPNAALRSKLKSPLVVLDAKKKRRRRKQPPSSKPQIASSAPPQPPSEADILPERQSGELSEEDVKKELAKEIGEVASFTFDPDEAKNMSFEQMAEEASRYDVPDMKEQLRKKEIQRRQDEMIRSKPKIRRDDRDAMGELLKRNPYADADDSLFVEESYGTVSAILGERTKPFLGIPAGFLQAGHLIGALGILLMAFVEYPGFPLTNLPSPLRGALQGGLGAVYFINTGLAVWAVFKAAERDQSVFLWGAKTFAIGGLALDQLTQLPKADANTEGRKRKGKRS